MKKNRILKLASVFSVLGISSLIIASCSQNVQRNPGYKNPNPPDLRDPSDQPGLVDSSNPINETQMLQELIKGLDASSFKLVNTQNNNEDVELESLEAETVRNDAHKYNFLLRDTSNIPAEWTYEVNITNTNTRKGLVFVDIQFNKENLDPVKSENSIEIDGFKSLATTIKKNLFSKIDLGEEYKLSNKTALNVGDAKFAKLGAINQQNNENGNGLQSAFAETLKDSGLNKEGIDKIKTTETTFNGDDLFITGEAVVDSIWKNETDKSVNFYLTSKYNVDPLKLRSKTSDDVDITIPGIVVKNIMPDDIKISVSKINVEGVEFDPTNQSNLEAYKKIVEGDQQGNDKYKIENDQLYATVSNKDYKINPIHIPYIPQKSNHKILFKARYIFDDKEMYTDAFSTKIAFKKIINESLTSDAVMIKELSDTENNKINYFGNLAIDYPTGSNISDRFFWMGVGGNGVTEPGQQSPDIEIVGPDNSDEGDGVVQMVNWKDKSNTNNARELVDSNNGEASNYIIYARLKYNKNASDLGYNWANQVTILHIDAPIEK
ncbi:hypothetical protein [Mycoplasma sp. E35C]|uniref:hypothetical protein n=1 Tax=Mycoplasma sp. E35C TaxID=2801918 RepID=UPI001CA43B86|nr:hypothetical protein [Mycoplasma sp. E35C]QZX49129.1 hypothetical protein JJE79_03700 [Mycoplasma sp. E35C]